MTTELEIKDIIDRETNAWDEKSIELLLPIFHPDMVWVWPVDPINLDPMTWVMPQGKFDIHKFTKIYDEWFKKFELIKNHRKIKKITLSEELDAAFAVVDVDTLWRSSSGEESHWFGRTGKSYVKTRECWKMINQVGVFQLDQLL